MVSKLKHLKRAYFRGIGFIPNCRGFGLIILAFCLFLAYIWSKPLEFFLQTNKTLFTDGFGEKFRFTFKDSLVTIDVDTKYMTGANLVKIGSIVWALEMSTHISFITQLTNINLIQNLVTC